MKHIIALLAAAANFEQASATLVSSIKDGHYPKIASRKLTQNIAVRW